MPSAAYIVSGELTLERKKDGKKQHFAAGQAVSETVDTLHRGSREMSPLYSSCSTPEVRTWLSLSIHSVDTHSA
jgi:hypothetical protein